MATANSILDLRELKARNPLGDVVERAGIALQGQGRVRQGLCPFHDEREGSFTVYSDSERWHCFGCGMNGDVIEFIQRVERLSFKEAVQRLDDGWHKAPQQVRAVSNRADSSVKTLTRRDPALLTQAVRFYAGQLHRSRPAKEYLAARGITPGTAVRLGLGYSTGYGLRSALESFGFPDQGIRDCGLFTGKGERFAGMVVAPELVGSRVQWLMGRTISPEKSPRFQALPGPKPVLGLSGLGQAQPFVVLTEGLFDWLTLVQWGYPACAALGTQGLERVAVALRGCRRVFLAFDNDEAGQAAATWLSELLGGRAATISLLCGAGDVADLAARPGGEEIFEKELTRAAVRSRRGPVSHHGSQKDCRS